MKKLIVIGLLSFILGPLSVLVSAVTVDEVAGTFKGLLNIGGTQYPNKEVFILPGTEANTITFVLPDFKYNAGDLGNIVLPNIPMDATGILTLEYTTLYIKAINERAEISVLNGFVDGKDTYNSVISASEAQVLLSIKAPSLPEPILVLFVGSKVTNENYNVTNGGFEGNWSNGEPQGWHSFNTATGDYASMVKNTDQFTQSTEKRPGTTGSYSALIMTKFVVGVPANGNCTNGQINAGSLTADDAVGNYNFSDPSNNGYNTPFVGNPDSLVFWSKYVPADKNPSNSVNQSRAHVVITTNARYQDPEAKDYSSVKIAEAGINYSATSSMDWQRIAVPFTYTSTDPTQAAYMLITFTSNKTPGGGSAYQEGGFFNKTDYPDFVYLDDVEMVYNYALKSLKLDGTEVSFTDGNATTELVYSDSDYQLDAQTDGKAAKSFIGYDATNNRVYVYVVPDNYSQARSYSVYTLQMAAPKPPVKDTEFAYEASVCDNESYSDELFKDLKEAGEYKTKIPNTQGGDSLITLTLTVLPTYSTPTEASVKMDETYTWRDKVYKDLAPGTYKDTVFLKTTAGCDSLLTLVLTVKSIGYEFNETQTVCRNEEATWRKKTLPTKEAGTFVVYDSLKSVYGQDSVYILTLTVLPTYSTPTEASIKMDETYTWKGKQYKDLAPGTYKDTVFLKTTAGCDSLLTLVLTVKSIGYEFNETQTACRNEEATWRKKTLPTKEAGTFVIYDSLKSVYGQDSVYILTLSVLPTYSFTETQHVNTIDIVWHGQVIKDLEPAAEPYVYHDSLLTTAGCDSVFTLYVHVSSIPITYGEFETSMCEGDQVTFEGVTYTDAFDGTIHVAATNIYGGDSIVHLSVVLLPNYTIDQYKTITIGDNADWEGWNLSTMPVGEMTLTTSYYTEFDCDSTLILHLTVEPKQVGTDLETITNHQSPITNKILYRGSLIIIRKDEKYDVLGTKIK